MKLNGYQTEEELLKALTNIVKEWYINPRRGNEFQRILFKKGELTDFRSELYRHEAGERIWISENAMLVYNHQNGEPPYYEGPVREITEEIRRAQIEECLVKLSLNLPGGLFQLNLSSEGVFFGSLCQRAIHQADGPSNQGGDRQSE